MEVLRPGGSILTVTENGFGKRTDIDEYRVQSRGGLGIINIQTSDRNGKVVAVACVTDDDELMLMTQAGKVLRMGVDGLRAIGRNAQGVKLMDMEDGDRVASIARLSEQAADEGDDPAIGEDGTEPDGGDETPPTPQ